MVVEPRKSPPGGGGGWDDASIWPTAASSALFPDERFHKTMLDEFYRIAFRKKVYATIDELQADLDAWMREFNEIRPHQGKWCFGKTPMQTFIDALPLAREKSGQLQAGEESHAA